MRGSNRPVRLGVIAAMPQEIRLLRQRFGAGRCESVGPREFICAETDQGQIVLTMSHIGKVAAATTAAILVDRFGVEVVVFTGVGGGVGQAVSIGDIVVADHLIQHDLDLKGVMGFDRFVIPSLGVARIRVDDRYSEVAKNAAQAVVSDPQYRGAVERLVGGAPAVHVGLIGSGDRFIGDSKERHSLLAAIPDLLAVEMEGAAVAQVCAEHGVPLVVSRIISDSADSEAHIDFTTFVEQAAAVGSECFVSEFLRRL